MTEFTGADVLCVAPDPVGAALAIAEAAPKAALHGGQICVVLAHLPAPAWVTAIADAMWLSRVDDEVICSSEQRGLAGKLEVTVGAMMVEWDRILEVVTARLGEGNFAEAFIVCDPKRKKWQRIAAELADAMAVYCPCSYVSTDGPRMKD
jgi:hypothetical protein